MEKRKAKSSSSQRPEALLQPFQIVTKLCTINASPIEVFFRTIGAERKGDN